MKTLNEQLRTLRHKQNLSQKQLAALSGVHQNTILNFENAQRSPSVETLSYLLEAMGYELVIRRKQVIS